MNNFTKNAVLGFVALFVIALLGLYFGSDQANPADAEPASVIIQPTDLDSVRLLPKSQRVQYITPSDFTPGTGSDPVPRPVGIDPPMPTPEPFSDDLRIVVVRQGDTLGAIAKRELGDSNRYRDIMDWNNITNERAITIGMQLQIRLQEVPVKTDAQTYVVQSGDVLGVISDRFYGTSKKVDLIIKANNLKDANSIRVGQSLIIPPQ
ncbi:MAG: nucleoid-associated protein YgaU [Myxococcota bacterium]|jgi:nucleoid-associated protein YgaU